MSAEYIAFDRAFAREFVLQVDVGQATAPDGATHVELTGDGELEASQVREDSETPDRETPDRETEQKPKRARSERQKEEQGSERVSGKIPPDDAARILEQVSLAQWDRRFPQRPGIPDEATVVVRFQRVKRDGTSVKLWLRDAEKDNVLGPVLEQLRRHVGELSGGRIYL